MDDKDQKSREAIIKFQKQNLLVSASAGTGKTTVMIDTIAARIREGVDVSEIAVMTFTNLAAAEMKSRLADKLSEMRGIDGISEQLEKLDNASICTIHAFCAELLRSRFYAVDIDPSFVILDNVTVNTLQENAFDEVFREYFSANDEVFGKIYKIFAKKRSEDNFRSALEGLYKFTRCFEDFPTWYDQNRQKFVEYSEDNPIVRILLSDIREQVSMFQQSMSRFAKEFLKLNASVFAANCQMNADALANVDLSTLESALNGLYTLKLVSLGRDKIKKADCGELSAEFDKTLDAVKSFWSGYATLSRGIPFDDLWNEMRESVVFADKLKEILVRFDEKFFQSKKQRNGVDFNDLEHLTLQLLNDEEALNSVRERYKYIFVDEYQDTNPVQEAIISRLAGSRCKMFMVGDIKQSIYGFRGCDPTIFLRKLNRYTAESQNPDSDNEVHPLQRNFRSNSEILAFVNEVFDCIMTDDFGKVNYRETSELEGGLPPALSTSSVQIDFIATEKNNNSEATEPYDISAPQSVKDAVTQGDVIAQKISRFVGMEYKDKFGTPRVINYGDIVVLLRSMKNNANSDSGAMEIYNTLVENNIPVSANFKTESFANKEVRDIINMLRAIDNPYNDIYLVGACLSPLGGFDQNDLARIKIGTDSDSRAPFCERMISYAEKYPDDAVSIKIKKFVEFTEQLRFYSHAATVGEVVLKILKDTDYQLYVQGFPNGTYRVRKLYSFVDGLKNVGYAQSIDKFLYFLDHSEQESEENIADSNAVRIMTMHASKGLEFPIVFIADCQHGFNFDDDEILKNSDFGFALKYYDFANMHVYDTLGRRACDVFNRKSNREEEMRLLYVAMTRAKYVLDIVADISSKDISKAKKPSAAGCHLDWIVYFLRRKYGDFMQADTSEQICVVTQKPQAEFSSQNLMCRQYETESEQAAVMEKLAYRYPFADQAKMPSKIVSSALDREYIATDTENRSAVWNQNNDRNELGTAYHKVFQYVSPDASEKEISETVAGLVNEGKIPTKFADRLDIHLISNVLRNPDLRALTSQGKVYHEMPFMLSAPYNSVAKDQRFSDDVMLQGVIDLLILGENKAIVVDYKFSTHKAELLKKDYRYQLTSYRLAVEKICGISDVESYILSIEDNALIKI